VPNLNYLPIGADAPNVVLAVIEIPKGSRNKIEYDGELESFKLNRVLYSSVQYPTAYGFIPSTSGGDGDPLDVLVMTDQPLTTGLVLDVIPIGALEVEDQAGTDLKIVSVAAFDPNINEIKNYTELPRHQLEEIEEFFRTYKILEKKKVTLGDWVDASRAREEIGNARNAFEHSRENKNPSSKRRGVN